MKCSILFPRAPKIVLTLEIIRNILSEKYTKIKTINNGATIQHLKGVIDKSTKWSKNQQQALQASVLPNELPPISKTKLTQRNWQTVSCCWWRHDPVRLTLYLSPFFLPIKAVPVNIHPKANKSNPCYTFHTTPPHKIQPLPLKLPWATLVLGQTPSNVLWGILLGTVSLESSCLELST